MGPSGMDHREVHEQALTFASQGHTLAGVLALPRAQARPDAGVVIIVGGPQYRAGSHRQFVLLARHLAATGYAVLRFDAAGMGDSTGPVPNFEQQDPDVQAALDALLVAVPSVSRVALWGLCDGASAALMYLARRGDARVQALCLANPWVRSETTQARAQVRHYYLDRLRQPAFWRKLLIGGVTTRALQDLWRNLRMAAQASPAATTDAAAPRSYQQLMAEGWRGFDGKILLLLSGNDYTAKEFADVAAASPMWSGALAKAGVERHDLAEADHTFSDHAQREQAERITAQWLLQSGLPLPAP